MRLARRRVLGGTIATLGLAVASALLLRPGVARAFTIPNLYIYFDAISVPVDHTLHVNVFNQFGADPVIVRALVKPTTPAAGSPVLGAPIVLQPGEGTDAAFAFAGFSPPAGATRVPVVCEIMVSLPPGFKSLTAIEEWSGKLANSVEIIDDTAGRPTAMLGSRHVVVPPKIPGTFPRFCLFCN